MCDVSVPNLLTGTCGGLTCLLQASPSVDGVESRDETATGAASVQGETKVSSPLPLFSYLEVVSDIRGHTYSCENIAPVTDVCTHVCPFVMNPFH